MRRQLKRKRKRKWLGLADEYGPTGAGLCVAILAVVLGLFALGFAIAIPIGSAQCHEAASRVGGVSGHYRLLTGCYFRLPGGREVPQDNYPPKYIKVVR